MSACLHFPFLSSHFALVCFYIGIWGRTYGAHTFPNKLIFFFWFEETFTKQKKVQIDCENCNIFKWRNSNGSAFKYVNLFGGVFIYFEWIRNTQWNKCRERKWNRYINLENQFIYFTDLFLEISQTQCLFSI